MVHLEEAPEIVSDTIEKDLEAEGTIIKSIAYCKLSGASKVKNFRSPDAYVFLFFEKASGTHSIDFVDYEERDFQIHISFPSQIHSWDTRDGAIGHKIILSKEFVENSMLDYNFLHTKINKNPVIDIDRACYQRLNRDVIYLSEELNENIYPQVIHIRTQLILAHINWLIEKCEKEKKSELPFLLQGFYKLLESNFRTQRNVKFYADQLRVSVNYLSFYCKGITRVTAKEAIDERIVLESKRLLLGSNLSIKEIACQLGFNSMSRFTVYLKSKLGSTPSQIRKR